MLSKASVAPNSIAFSRFQATGSMATTRLAPAAAAPWTLLMPTPPTPMTTTVSPGRTSATRVAEPQPVVTPQPTSAACVQRDVLLDLDDRGLVDGDVGRERAELAHARDALAVIALTR